MEVSCKLVSAICAASLLGSHLYQSLTSIPKILVLSNRFHCVWCMIYLKSILHTRMFCRWGCLWSDVEIFLPDVRRVWRTCEAEARDHRQPWVLSQVQRRLLFRERMTFFKFFTIVCGAAAALLWGPWLAELLSPSQEALLHIQSAFCSLHEPTKHGS